MRLVNCFRQWVFPAFIVGFACILLALHSVGCRIIDPGYGNGYVPEGPSKLIFQSSIQPNQEYRVQSEEFEYFLPDGAVSRPNQLSIYRTLRETGVFPVPASWTLLSNVYSISQMGSFGNPFVSVLNKPALIRMPFFPSLVPAGADQSDIFVACFDGARGLVLITPSVDMTRGLAVVQSYHFSDWAVLARPTFLRPKSLPASPRVVTEPSVMAAAAGTRFPRDLIFTISFELPSGATGISTLNGWYMQFFPMRQTSLDLAHPTIDSNRRTLSTHYPYLEPVDLLKDPFVTRSYDGSRGVLTTRLIFTDKTPAEAPNTLIWRVGARDPIGLLYEREGQVTFTVEGRQIILAAPLGTVPPGQPLDFSWNLIPAARAYESALLQIAAHPEGFLLPLFETSFKPATTTYRLDPDVAMMLPQDSFLYWRIVGTDLYKTQPTSLAGRFRIGISFDPFEVIGTFPSSSSSDVSPGTSISAVFNRAVASSTLISSVNITPAAPGELTTSANSFTFVPANYLLENTNYFVEIATTVKDLGGNALAEPFGFSFTTGNLGAAGFVNVLQMVPPPGSQDVPTQQPLELVFDRDMTPVSVQNAFQASPAPIGQTVWTWVSPRHLRIMFPQGLSAATQYRFKLDSSAASLRGETLQDDLEWSLFTSVQSDVTPPQLLTISPVDGARNVPTNAAVSFSFDEPMSVSSVENAISIVSPSVVPLDFTWAPGAKTVSVKPIDGWLPNVVYRLSLTAEASDISGNEIETPVLMTFSTGGQDGPILVSSKPSAGELSVSPVSRMDFTFDRPMIPNKVQAAFSVTPVPAFAPTFLWSGDNSRLTVTYPAPFSDGTDVRAEFSVQAQDLNGLPLAGPAVIAFRTGDFTPPAFSGVNPASGSTQLPVNSPIVFRFNEPMNQVNPERLFTIVPLTSGLSYAWNNDRTELSLSRTTDWPGGALFNFTVSGDLKDTAGNLLGASITLNLSFGSISAPIITELTPPDGSVSVARTSPITVKFDRAMDQLKTEAAIVASPFVQMIRSWSGDFKTLTLTPATPLANQTLYFVSISPAAADQNGISLIATRTFSFSTADTISPELVSATPNHLTYSVSRTASLSFTFSESLDTLAAQGAFSLTPPPPGATVFNWANASRTLIVSFAAPLTEETSYLARFGLTLRDLSGNTLTAPLETQFVTESTVQPLITLFQPVEGSVGVAMNASLRFSFNKPMATSTVQVTVSPTPGGTAIYSWSSDLMTMTYKTAGDFTNGLAYTAVVSPTAQDAFRNAITGTRTLTFTAGSSVSSNAIFSPTDGTSGVTTSTKPIVIFDKAMNQASVLSGLSIVPAPGVVTPNWSGDDKTLTLDLGTLSALATYTISLSPTILDAAGVPLGRTFSTSFLTQPGAPTITAFDPADAATGIGLNTPISITFSQTMSSGTVSLTMTPAPLGTRSIGWSADSRALTATWTIGFEATKNYQIEISAGSQDTFGQGLAGTRIAQFVTATVAGPVVQNFQPAIGSQSVLRTTQLTVGFDRVMDQANTQAAFVLTPPPISPPVFLWSGDGKNLVINFPQPLEFDTYYTAAFQTTARDLNQVRLAGAFSSWFVTESRPTILANGVTPAPNASEIASEAFVRVAFSKPMDKIPTQSAFSLKIGPTTIPGTLSWESNTLVFKPSSPLSAAATFTIAVTTGARDTTGNTIASPWSSTFRTFVPDLSVWRKDLADDPDGSATQFSPRAGHAVVTFNNKLWVIGGFDDDYLNDIWSSLDGTTWTRVTPSAAFSKRRNHACAVWNNSIWLTGGVNQITDSDGFPIDNYLDDVWRSSDGVTWTRVSASAEYFSRAEHAMVVFNNQLWMVGGITTDTDENVVLLGDAWSSSNGTNWTERSLVVGFSERRGAAAFVALSKIWVVGGYGVDTITQQQRPLNDVWSSLSGDTWGRVSASAAFSGRSNAGYSYYKNRLTICGGSGQDTGGWEISFNDIWTSSDGLTWNRNKADGPEAADHFSRRFQHHLGVNNSRLYLIGGEAADGATNDVWSTP